MSNQVQANKNPRKVPQAITWKDTLRLIGPGIVWATAAIGSGELIISSRVGSEYGYVFIWALWIGIWLKYWIQRGILDLTVLSGEPIVDVWSKLPGGRFINLYWILFFILTMTGVSGLLGLTASIADVLLPLGVNIWAIIIILVVIVLSYFQNYASFEKFMLVLSLILAIGAIGAAVLAQPNVSEIFVWELPSTVPITLAVLALLGWGAGSGPDLMLPYSWWVAEKGYHKLEVKDNEQALMHLTDEESVTKVKSWLNVIKWDTIVGYLITGIVASVFMIVGAAILRPRGILVEGIDVLTRISSIFTDTYGSFTFILFMVPAFAAIFSTTLGVFDGCRIGIAHLARLLTGRERVPIGEMRKNNWYRISLVVFSLIPLFLFLGISRPVALILFASVVSAISMPFLAIVTLWSIIRVLPKVYRPNRFYLFNLVLSIVVYLLFMGQSLYQIVTGN